MGEIVFLRYKRRRYAIKTEYHGTWLGVFGYFINHVFNFVP